MSNSEKEKNIHSGHRKRVKEKALQKGFSYLDDHQLLELLLFYSIPREDTNALAHTILNEFGSFNELLKASSEQLKNVKGVGDNTALLLSVIGELSKRASKLPLDKRMLYKCSEDFKNLACTTLKGEAIEKVYVFCFDSNGKLKKTVEISSGDEASAVIDVKLAVKALIDSDSKKAVLAHNHPLGEAVPSAADIDSTRSVSVMLRKLGFLLADHIIIGESGDSYSMYEDSDLSLLFY